VHSVTTGAFPRDDRLAAHSMASARCGVDTVTLTRVALIDVLEDGRALLLVEVGRVDSRQAGVQHVLDGKSELSPGRGLLAPVQDEQLLEPGRSSRTTFFTSRRSPALKSGAGRVRMSKMKERFVRRVRAVGEPRRVALVLSPPRAPLRSLPKTARASGETRADDSASGNRKNFTRFSWLPGVSD